MPRHRRELDTQQRPKLTVHEDAQEEIDWGSWDQLPKGRLEWLWPGRLAFGTLALVEGRKSAGKGLVCVALAAALTGGPRPPGVKKVASGPVVWLGQEESARYVTRHRLLAAGGDPSLVRFPTEKDRKHRPRALYLPNDLDQLEGFLTRTGGRLIVADPITSMLAPHLSPKDDRDVRRALEPLASVLEDTGALFLGIRHIRKSTYGPALDHGLGGVGWGNVARSVLRVDRDPSNRDDRLLSVLAVNSGEEAPTLRFRPEAAGDHPTLRWLGRSEMSPEEIAEAAGDASNRAALEDAHAFLRDALRKGEQLAADLVRHASEAGISPRTLYRAKTELRITSHPRGPNSDRKWMWRPPASWPAGGKE